MKKSALTEFFSDLLVVTSLEFFPFPHKYYTCLTFYISKNLGFSINNMHKIAKCVIFKILLMMFCFSKVRYLNGHISHAFFPCTPLGKPPYVSLVFFLWPNDFSQSNWINWLRDYVFRRILYKACIRSFLCLNNRS